MISNLFCSIDDDITKRLLVPNIDIDNNHTNIEINGVYEMYYIENDLCQVLNFSLTKTAITTDYDYVAFSDEYSNINYISSNAMTEDLYDNAINNNIKDISVEFTNVIYDDIDNLSISFEFNRSSNMIIRGNIDTFNFDMIYKEIITDEREVRNENYIINASNNHSLSDDIFNYCNYPVPSDFNYIYTTEWIDLYLDIRGYGDNEYGTKTQSPECRDSYHPFWIDPYMNMCQDPTDFLTKIDDVFSKVFECKSSNQIMTEYNWYYSIEQLQILAGSSYADQIKIVVYDNENNTVYSAISKPDSYPIVNLRNNRSLSNPLYYNISEQETYFFSTNAWDNYSSDSMLLQYMNNNIDNKCNEFHPFNLSYLDPPNYYNLNEYLYDNCNLDNEGILSIDFNNNKCNIFNSNNVTIEIYINSGFKTISSGYIKNGKIDTELSATLLQNVNITNNFDIKSQILFAYGQHELLKYYVFPDQYYYFSIHDLSPAQYYTISFSLNRQCYDFTLELETIDGFEFITIPPGNITKTIQTTTLWESTPDDTDQYGKELRHNVKFFASASNIDFRFVLSMHDLSETDPRISDCFIDISYDDIIGCLGGDDILSCKNKSDVRGDICSPFHLISDSNKGITFDEADGYCYSEYGTHLFTNPDSSDYDTMKNWMTGLNVKAWIGLSRIPRSSTDWYWIDINQTQFNPSIISVCSSDIVTPRSSKYLAYDVKKNWMEGEEFCSTTQGTNLASIHSSSDNDLILSELTASGCSGYAWIGFNDKDREREFVWSDASSVNYKNWGGGQPNSCCQAQQDCVEYRHSGSSNWWNDWDCNLDNCIICNSPFPESCRAYDQSLDCLTHEPCGNDQIYTFFCQNEWKHAINLDKANWVELPQCIQTKLTGFATISDLTVMAVYNDNNENETNSTADTGCVESSVGIISVEPQFIDNFGCFVEYDLNAYSYPMYQISYEIYYDPKDIPYYTDNKTLYSNITYILYPNSIDDILTNDENVGINVLHSLNGFDQMLQLLHKHLMIHFQRHQENYTYYTDLFKYYKDNSFTNNIYPFYSISSEWDYTSCDGEIENNLGSISFNNMLKNNVNNTLYTQYSYNNNQYIIPFVDNFIYNNNSTQNITFNISLSNDEDFFKYYASALSDNVGLLPTGFVHDITLSDQNDYFYLDLQATFVHCMSSGYAMLRVYVYNQTENERELIYKYSILNTQCPTTIQFQFEIPSIYFLHKNNLNITEMLLSNETFKLIPFMIEWDDLQSSYRMKPNLFIGNYRLSTITYAMPYQFNYIQRGLPWIVSETPFLVLFVTLFAFSMLFLLCTSFQITSCKKRKDPKYKCSFYCIKCLKRKITGTWVLDATKTHKQTLEHVFFIHFRDQKKRKSSLRSQKSVKKFVKENRKKFTPFEKALNIIHWIFLFTITAVFCISEFTEILDFDILDTFDSKLFRKSSVILIGLSTSIGIWILWAFLLYLHSRCKGIDFFEGESIIERRERLRTGTESSVNYAGVSNNTPTPKPSDAETSKLEMANMSLSSIESKEQQQDNTYTTTDSRGITQKFKENKFNCTQHGAYIMSEICCRLIETFVFTISFWIAFGIWYASPQIHAIGTDLPQAIRALNADTDSKISIINDWETNEINLMEWYYNNKSIECKIDMDYNANLSQYVMNDTKIYHVEQMNPTIPELIRISNWLRARITTILQGAAQGQYVADVQKVMDEIKEKVENGLKLLSNIKDFADTIADALCIASAAPLALCGGLTCAAVGAGICIAAKELVGVLKDKVVEAAKNYAEISETAEAPEVSGSAGQTPRDRDNSNIDASESYPQDEESEITETNSGNTNDINHGEQQVQYEEADLNPFLSLPIFSIFGLIGLLDGIIVYRKLIKITQRAMDLKNGIPHFHDFDLDVAKISGFALFVYYFKKSGGTIMKLFLFAIPMAYALYALFYIYDSIQYMFFDLNVIESFGIYQLWTLPVISKQISTNQLLQSNMKIYNQQLLPSLETAMTTNIETIQKTIYEHNILQHQNVTLYNQQKCEIQLKIASYGDTLYCFQKFIKNMSILPPIEEEGIPVCNGCFTNINAMCLNAVNLITKEYEYKPNNNTNDTYNEFLHNPFKSAMPERRKYCHPNDKIIWSENNNDKIIIDAQSMFETSSTLTCPDNMIINKINMKGSPSNSFIPSSQDTLWNGYYDNKKYISYAYSRNFVSADSICKGITSNLASIHSSNDNTEIYNMINSETWIGLTDSIDETRYVWTDGSSYDYNDYNNWSPGQPNHGQYCAEKDWYNDIFGVLNRDWSCQRWANYGESEDGVKMLSSNGKWQYDNIGDRKNFACFNPNTQSMTSEMFKNLFESIECVSVNRGPLGSCQDFTFKDNLFSTPNIKFYCEKSNSSKNSYDLSGYGPDAAWFLQGFNFNDLDIENKNDLSALISIKCCTVSGTVYKQINDEEPDDEGISIIDQDIDISPGNNVIGIKNISRGSSNSIDSFIFDGIKDFIPNGDVGTMQKVDYEIFSDENKIIRPKIDSDILLCEEGCDEKLTSECSEEYVNDENANPFVKKFVCTNIEFKKAVIDQYAQCEINPVFAAFFYDYDQQKHQEMIINQLTPYYTEIGNVIIKIWEILFIFIAFKVAFKIWFKIIEKLVDFCCGGIHKIHKVEVDMLYSYEVEEEEEKLQDIQEENNDDLETDLSVSLSSKQEFEKLQIDALHHTKSTAL